MDVQVNENQLDEIRTQLVNVETELTLLSDAISNVSTSSYDSYGAGGSVTDLMGDINDFDGKISSAKSLLSDVGDHVELMWVESEPEAETVWSSWFGSEWDQLGQWNQALFDHTKPGSSIDGEKDPINKTIQEGLREQSTLYKGGNDADYKYGKHQAFKNVNFYSKKWDLKGKYGEDINLFGVPTLKGSVDLPGGGKLSGSLRLGALDASATFEVGPDHVNLGAEASFTAVRAETAYESPALSVGGVDVLKFSSKGEVDLLHAEAKAKVGVGVYTDENGETHFEAGAQVKAEADLFKVSGSTSVDVLGVKGTVSGGVKFGIGAQANVGFVDGEFKCNLSVAAGLGFELGFSVDVSGAIETGKKVLGWFGIG